MIRAREPGAGKGGEAPAKKCPECLALIHAGYRVCPDCGYEFPPNDANGNLSGTASTAAVLSGQADYTEYEVLDTCYAVHEKRGADPDAPRTVRIDYQVGFNEFKSEWVCPEHTGYAREKFIKWWRERAAYGLPIPTTAREAVVSASAGMLADPESITVKTIAEEKFARVVGWRLKSRPVYEPPLDTVRNDPDDLYDPDEIPF
jgi:DNA repair protein RadD